jgi:ABC-2 type transport system permease protein
MLTIFLGSGLASFFPTANQVENFSNFFYSGVLVLSIVVNVFDATISLVWDKEFGFMREILVAPMSKPKVVIGKILGAVTRGLMQGIALLIVAPILGINFFVYQIFLLLLLMVLISITIASLGIIVASFIKRIEMFSFFSQIFVSPMLFLSGAFFTLEKIPH